MTAKTVYGIEGLDRLGKSTLIDGIRQALGYYEVIHFSKPQKLAAYAYAQSVQGVPPGGQQVWHYQHEGFLNSMLLANSGARIIFDRWHLGEAVYSPMYRFYNGDYVFDLEKNACVDLNPNIRLILLTEDFQIARHFVDDGESLGAVEQREEEQDRFLVAFHKSNIVDKRIVCVTDPGLGGFKPKDWILAEALA
jgi:thymidylate kinase